MIVYSPANEQISAVSHLNETLQSCPVVPAPGQSPGASLLSTLPLDKHLFVLFG